MSHLTSPNARPDGHEIVSERVISAPCDVVFGMFMNPAMLKEWWGPEGFTNSFEEFDPRPGGAWRFTMHGPDGANYPMEKRFVDVIPHQRVELEHLQPMHHFLMTMTFAPEGNRTRLCWRMQFDSADDTHRVREIILKANEQNFDRLEALLATPP